MKLAFLTCLLSLFICGKDDERRRRVVALFLKRPAEKRAENDVLAFYGWLEQNRRELLKRGHGAHTSSLT